MSGKISHSVTFEWKFSGEVDTVTWGLANKVGKDIDKRFVSLDGRGVDVLPLGSVPEAYRGRVKELALVTRPLVRPASHLTTLQKMMRDFMDVC